MSSLYSFLSLLAVFSAAHLTLPFQHHVRELIGDVFIAGNVIRTFLALEGRTISTVQRDVRSSALDYHVLMEIAWYLASIPYTRDAAVLLHHALTVTVVSIAYLYNVTYITFLVLSSIIWSNILLGASKAAYYRSGRSHAALMTKVLFVCFGLSFLVFRIVILPFYIMPMIVFDIRDYWVHERGVGLLYWLVVGGVAAIVAMQFYWMGAIVRKLLLIL